MNTVNEALMVLKQIMLEEGRVINKKDGALLLRIHKDHYNKTGKNYKHGYRRWVVRFTMGHLKGDSVLFNNIHIHSAIGTGKSSGTLEYFFKIINMALSLEELVRKPYLLTINYWKTPFDFIGK